MTSSQPPKPAARSRSQTPATDPVITVTCPFCSRIHAGDVWATTDPKVFTFLPLNPVTPGHRLFVPARHVPDASTDPWLTGVTFQAAATYALVALPTAPSFNLITSCGAPATQTVPHLHVHYVPRTEGDGLRLPWSATD